MKEKIKNLTIDFTRLLKLNIPDRFSFAQTSEGQSYLASLTPAQLAAMFPSYYKKQLPDLGRSMSGTYSSPQPSGVGATAGAAAAGTSTTPPAGPSTTPPASSGTPAGRTPAAAAGAPSPSQTAQENKRNALLDRLEKITGKPSIGPQSQSDQQRQQGTTIPSGYQRIPGGIDRSKLFNELKDPETRRLFGIMLEAEVGGQKGSHTAFAEKVFNRAMIENRSLKNLLSDTRYFQPYTDGRFKKAEANISKDSSLLDKHLQTIDSVAYTGSDTIKGATHNASGTVAKAVKGIVSHPRYGDFNSDKNTITDVDGETYYAKTFEREKIKRLPRISNDPQSQQPPATTEQQPNGQPRPTAGPAVDRNVQPLSGKEKDDYYSQLYQRAGKIGELRSSQFDSFNGQCGRGTRGLAGALLSEKYFTRGLGTTGSSGAGSLAINNDYLQKSGFYNQRQQISAEQIRSKKFLDSLPIGTVIASANSGDGHAQIKVAKGQWVSDKKQGNNILESGSGGAMRTYAVITPNQAGLSKLDKRVGADPDTVAWAQAQGYTLTPEQQQVATQQPEAVIKLPLPEDFKNWDPELQKYFNGIKDEDVRQAILRQNEELKNTINPDTNKPWSLNEVFKQESEKGNLKPKEAAERVITEISNAPPGQIPKDLIVNEQGYVAPVTGTLMHGGHGRSAGFGDPRAGYNHGGTDVYSIDPETGKLRVGKDAPVVAPMDGTYAGTTRGQRGGYITTFIDKQGKKHLYMHVSKDPGINPDTQEPWKQGDKVKQGQTLTHITGSGTLFEQFANEKFNGDLKAAAEHLDKVGWGQITKPHLHAELLDQEGKKDYAGIISGYRQRSEGSMTYSNVQDQLKDQLRTGKITREQYASEMEKLTSKAQSSQVSATAQRVSSDSAYNLVRNPNDLPGDVKTGAFKEGVVTHVSGFPVGAKDNYTAKQATKYLGKATIDSTTDELEMLKRGADERWDRKIGYHAAVASFYVDQNGNRIDETAYGKLSPEQRKNYTERAEIHELRGPNKISYHAGDANEENYGMVLVGKMSDAKRAAMREHIAQLTVQGHLTEQAATNVRGHGELPEYRRDARARWEGGRGEGYSSAAPLRADADLIRQRVAELRKNQQSQTPIAQTQTIPEQPKPQAEARRTYLTITGERREVSAPASTQTPTVQKLPSDGTVPPGTLVQKLPSDETVSQQTSIQQLPYRTVSPEDAAKIKEASIPQQTAIPVPNKDEEESVAGYEEGGAMPVGTADNATLVSDTGEAMARINTNENITFKNGMMDVTPAHRTDPNELQQQVEAQTAQQTEQADATNQQNNLPVNSAAMVATQPQGNLNWERMMGGMTQASSPENFHQTDSARRAYEHATMFNSNPVRHYGGFSTTTRFT